MRTKDEGRKMKDDVKNAGKRMRDEARTVRRRRAGWIVLVSSFILLPSSFCWAAGPTQDEVLRSIEQSVGQTVDGSKLLATGLIIVAVIVLIALVNYRRNRKVIIRALNHPGKLLKEVARGVNLKPVEIRQLRLLAEDQALVSPLVLLLCPSVLARAARAMGDRVDRRVIAGIASRLRQPAAVVENEHGHVTE